MTTEENLARAKAAQRRQGIAARQALEPAARRVADAAICARVASLAAWRQAGRVLAYAAFGGEPDLSALMEGCGKQVAYPVCGEGCPLTAALPALVDGWEAGAYGIRTPVLARARILPPDGLDLVQVPCTAFDADCRRVGMGKGYYDRFLSRFSGVTAGACYHCCTTQSLPHGRYDRPVDYLFTERYVRRLAPPDAPLPKLKER